MIVVVVVVVVGVGVVLGIISISRGLLVGYGAPIERFLTSCDKVSVW